MWRADDQIGVSRRERTERLFAWVPPIVAVRALNGHFTSSYLPNAPVLMPVSMVLYQGPDQYEETLLRPGQPIPIIPVTWVPT